MKVKYPNALIPINLVSLITGIMAKIAFGICSLMAELPVWKRRSARQPNWTRYPLGFDELSHFPRIIDGALLVEQPGGEANKVVPNIINRLPNRRVLRMYHDSKWAGRNNSEQGGPRSA